MGARGSTPRSVEAAGRAGRNRLPASRLRRSVWLRAIPFAITALIVLLQLVTPPWVQVGFLLVVIPPLAAMVNGPLVTAAASAAVVLVFVELDRVRAVTDAFADARHLELPMIVMVGAVSVVIAWVRDRVDARLVRVSNVAEAAQQAMLSRVPRHVGGMTCASDYRSAAGDARIGGDFFDVRSTPFGVRAVLGDVQGHGLGAVSAASWLLGAFREGALDDVSLLQLGRRMERRLLLERDVAEVAEPMFATVLLLEYDVVAGLLRAATFGHPPPVLLRAGRARELLLRPSPPIGLGGILAAHGELHAEPLRGDDLVFGYTDGVSEARDEHDGQYPVVARLDRWSRDHPRAAPQDAVDFVDEDLRSGRYRLLDDAALLVLGVDRFERS